MLFWKKKRDSVLEPSASQISVVADGYSAVVETETNVCEVVGISPHCFREMSKRKGNDFAWKQVPGNHTPAIATGAAIAGCRAAGIVDDPGEVEGNLPLVQQLICGPKGHDRYYANADSGCFQLFASNVQEAADFSLIAHYIAELALIPGICAQDGQTAHSLQQLYLLDPAAARDYLQQDVWMESPTPSQKILCGEKRLRVPCWNDIDHPATTGSIEGEKILARAMAARRTFFHDHVVKIAERAFEEYAKLTGRQYARVSDYRAKDADYIVIAQGGVTEDLRVLIEILRREKIKAGVLGIAMLSPFPGKEIAGLLKGKKAVTVLEKTVSMGQELPLIGKVRCALDKAMENGREGIPVYPEYPAYHSLLDRPQMFSGIYGLGGEKVSLANLQAVFSNMFDSGKKQKLFYVGLPCNLAASRFPKHELLQQNIRRDYPRLTELLLCGNTSVGDFPEQLDTLRVYFADGDCRELANLLATTLATTLKKQVKTSLSQIPQSLQPLAFTIAVGGDFSNHAVPDSANIAVMSAQQLLETPSPALQVTRTLLIDTEVEPKQLWEQLPQATAEYIRREKLNCFYIDGRQVVCEISRDPGRQNSLIPHIWLGAMAAVFVDSNEQFNTIAKEYGKLLGNGILAEECTNAFMAGQAIEKFDYSDFQLAQTLAGDFAPPWTVAQTGETANPTLDLDRFWKCSGYFYRTGKKDNLLTDPFIATGTIPARSSAFANNSGMRSFLPSLINENCTGCGMCFAACPDSAIPGVVQQLPTLLEGAIAVCKGKGDAIDDLPRLGKHLLGQAHRIFSADGLNQYQTLGHLFQDAFAVLMEKMTLPPDQRNKVAEEFGKILEVVRDFPIVKTDIFFNAPDAREKGSGALFSLAVNLESCKGCMECVAVCPENALEPIVQTEERLEAYRKNWQYFMSMPSNTELIERHAKDRPLYRMLEKKAYFSLVGGDKAVAGSGEKTAIHLLSAAVDAKMGDNVRPFMENLADVVEKLEREIQESVNKTLEVRDWESFGQSLAGSGRQNIDAKALAQILNDSGSRSEIDKNRLKRMTVELSQLKELLELYQKGSNGDGRSRMTVISSDSCMDWGRQYPHTPFSFPCSYHRDPAGMAPGVFKGTMTKMARAFKALRMAELDLCNGYAPQIHDHFFENFSHSDFTPQEMALCPPVLVVIDAKNANWDGIFSLLARRLPIKIAILDRRGPTPADRETALVDPGLMFMAMREFFVLQTTAAAADHFISGVMEGIAAKGPAVFYIYAPNANASDQAMARSHMAVQSRTFPLFKYNPEMEALSLEGNPFPSENWALQNFASPSLFAGEKSYLTPAHWAAGESDWSEHWKITKSGRHSGMKLLGDYLLLSEKERENLQPVIEYDDGQKADCLEISESLAHFSEKRLARWLFLKQLAGPIERVPETPDDIELWQQKEREIRAQYTEELERLEQEHGAVYQERLKNTLLSLCNSGGDDLRMKLREYVEQKRTN